MTRALDGTTCLSRSSSGSSMATAAFREDIVRRLRQMQDMIREAGAKCIVLSVPDGAARRARSDGQRSATSHSTTSLRPPKTACLSLVSCTIRDAWQRGQVSREQDKQASPCEALRRPLRRHADPDARTPEVPRRARRDPSERGGI